MVRSGPRVRRGALGGAHRAGAALVALLFLLPLAWAVSMSLREAGSPLPRTMEWTPSPVAWGNYRSVFGIVDARRFVANSLLVAGLATPITIVVASWAGFAISQLSPAWRSRLVGLSVACLMVPLTAIWLPRFVLFAEAGLIDRRLALVVPALMGTSPFFVLLFLWAFMRVPREVYDAARIDGASPFRTWAEIGLPLARPATVSVAVLSFVHYWNSFVEPLLYIRTDERMTVSLGLRVLYQLDRTGWPIVLAGAVLATAPVVVVFLLAQRAFGQDRRGRGVLAE